LDRHIYIHNAMLTRMIYTMTSSIGAHIYIHYTMLTPMVYTVTSSIGAHTYALNYAHAHGINDDKFDRGAYIHTTLCSCQWYTR
jgi:hypothetical protein